MSGEPFPLAIGSNSQRGGSLPSSIINHVTLLFFQTKDDSFSFKIKSYDDDEDDDNCGVVEAGQ